MRISRYYLIPCIALLLGMLSCSDDQAPAATDPLADPSGVPFAYTYARGTDVATSVNCALYIFSRKQATEKYCLDSILPVLDAATRLKFDNGSLSTRMYRFLFIATPGDAGGVDIVQPDAAAPEKGTAWDQLRLRPRAAELSIDNYYDVVDLSGKDILDTDSIRGQLTRFVGQVVFQFSKIGTSITDIQPIDDPLVTSILDRVHDIEITYEGYTAALAFTDDGDLVPAGNATAPRTQRVTPTLDARLCLPLPQASLELVNDDIALGGRVMGLYFLPGTDNVSVTLVFHYYDTTPTCQTAHVHTADCYDSRTLRLLVPDPAVRPGLPVEANAYTVSKAGVRCNRLIDVKTNHDIQISTDWNIN